MNSVIISFAGGSFLLFSFPKQPFIELDVVNIFFCSRLYYARERTGMLEYTNELQTIKTGQK